MRQPRGVLLPPITKARPRRGDIYHALRTAILNGVLAAGEKLPSTRHAAGDYGVSRGTVEEVFAQLTDEGFLQRAVGRGTFVAAAATRLNTSRRHNGGRPVLHLARRGKGIAANAACREPAVLRAFNAGIADTSEFPWAKWQRLVARAGRELGHSAMVFADPRGLPKLRSAISRYLAQFRGIGCDGRQVVIFNSAQQALNALSILLLNRGDEVCIEDPCYLGARAAFSLAGANLVPVPVDDEGIRVDTGTRRCATARLAYVTPSHQYPTGAVLSLERRIELLEWAARSNSWILEDDYDGEFRYEGQPLTSLYSLDSRQRVVYLGTLNKSMFVSLRLAYAVVPEALVEPLANIRTQLDGFTQPVQQMAMSLFMDEGHFPSHLRRMRSVYGAKRVLLTEGLAPLLAKGWTAPRDAAGMQVMLRHRRGDYVRTVAAQGGLEIALLSSYRATRQRDDGLFLRFGALSADSIKAGIHALLTAEAKSDAQC